MGVELNDLCVIVGFDVLGKHLLVLYLFGERELLEFLHELP